MTFERNTSSELALHHVAVLLSSFFFLVYNNVQTEVTCPPSFYLRNLFPDRSVADLKFAVPENKKLDYKKERNAISTAVNIRRYGLAYMRAARLQMRPRRPFKFRK